MDIIPVIDLLQGHVVHAKRGERHLYQPIESRLCNGSDPIAIIHALMELYPFNSLYIADLDAIQQRGDHHEIICKILDLYPMLDIWLDAGIRSPHQLDQWGQYNLSLVIGSEGMLDIEQYSMLRSMLDPEHSLLSLDVAAHGLIGPKELFEDPRGWPSRVIAMSLSRVGSSEGPDIKLTTDLVAKSAGSQIIAAGGIRGSDDIHLLEQIGVKGVLVASALHDGRINAKHLNP